MRKLLGMCLIFMNSYGFSQGYPEKKHFCEASIIAMKNMEMIFMPKTKTFCNTDDDCTYLRVAKWKKAEALNKTALACYRTMVSDPGYKKLATDSKVSCDPRYPRIEFPPPESSECVSNVCTLNF